MTEEVTTPPAGRARTSAAPSAAAARMRRHQERRRQGLLWLAIEVRETEVDALVLRGLLAAESRHDCYAVREALYQFLERQLESEP